VPSLVWVITGLILFGGMTAGAIRLWIKRRSEDKVVADPFGDTKMGSGED